MAALDFLISFENLRELRRLCHWGPIIALGVIIICSIVAVLDSVLWYWPLDTPGGSLNFLTLINWTVMILYNYFNAMFIGPGFVPLGWKPVSTASFFLLLCHSGSEDLQTMDPTVYINPFRRKGRSPYQRLCSVLWIQSIAVRGSA